jgi:nucleoid-associated protein YgaU
MSANFLRAIGAAALALLAAAAIKGGEKKPASASTPSSSPIWPPPWPPLGAPVPGIPTSVPGLPRTPAPGDCLLDPLIPPEIASVVNGLLRASSAADLQRAATMCETGGLPLAAGCLRARAAELGGATPATFPLPDIIPADMPGLGFPPRPAAAVAMHTIKSGDVPYGLAQRYTGDPNRWRELGSANPDLGPLKTVPSPTTGVPTTNYAGWRVGKTIALPAGWGAAAAPPTYAARAARSRAPGGRANA